MFTITNIRAQQEQVTLQGKASRDPQGTGCSQEQCTYQQRLPYLNKGSGAGLGVTMQVLSKEAGLRVNPDQLSTDKPTM